MGSLVNRLKSSGTVLLHGWEISKYPPAEPEALRLLAPQRGLIATGEKQKQLQRHEARQATGFGKNEGNSGRYTPGILKV